MDNVFFFDTYAIIELIKGNENYRRFQDAKIVTTVFNITELHYALLRDFSRAIAEKQAGKFWGCIAEVTWDDVKEANYLKYGQRKKKVSAVDAIGYVMAKRLGIKFITGDKEFSETQNVEFVK